MNRFISPPRIELPLLIPPLTPELRKVFDFFDRNLPLEWEIYIQPYLNGLRPDFVLLNQNVGVAVFEVKNWNLNSNKLYVENNKLYTIENNEKIFLENNPFSKIKLYKDEIYNLYCPRLSGDSNSRKSFAVISSGIIVPFSDSSSVKNLLNGFLNHSERNYTTISGYNEINNRKVDSVLPAIKLNKSLFMCKDYADDLRGWLVEPAFASLQRNKPKFDAQQQTIVNTRTSTGYRRIKGPAGSGKTLVLAARAAQLANQGLNVLICTYNITLYNYIHNIILSFLDHPKNINNITFINFHSLCRRICYQNNYENKYLSLFKSDDIEKILAEYVPELVLKIANTHNLEQYDACFVDEGQDFQPLWWNVLRKLCKNDSEKVLVVDKTQDIYDTAKAWTDVVMSGLGFIGRWVQLEYSYRLPSRLVKISSEFAKNFLNNENIELPKENTYLEQQEFINKCNLKWIQSNVNNLNKNVLLAVNEIMLVTGKENRAYNSEITIIVDSKERGMSISNSLEEKNIKTVDTFSYDNMLERGKKISFFMQHAKVKITTIHSLKGWECRLLIIAISHAQTLKDLHLFYTALTRVQKNIFGSWLTVVCAEPSLANFGKKWFEFKDYSVMNDLPNF